jgi:hypothetical protein
VRQGRIFFSEEKKQKTFTNGFAGGVEHATCTRRNPLEEKFFASFFQKRSASLLVAYSCCSKN